MDKVALIGGGLVGQAWAIVFARGGLPVALYDPEPAALERARAGIANRVEDLVGFDLLRDPAMVLERIVYLDDLETALAGAGYVQESVPETLEAKRVIFEQLDRLAAPEAVLASSTSGIPASSFTEGLRGRARCLVAHPINPPHLVPLVELCPAPWTETAVVDRAHALMRAVGQAPIRVRREVQGFVANRMQGALIGAALRMVEDGVASAEDVDVAIRDGIGLRWSFMGPFETIDLNAPGGIADYLRRYGALYRAIEDEHEPLDWTAEALLGKVEAQRREILSEDELQTRSMWRDRRLTALIAHKHKAAGDEGD